MTVDMSWYDVILYYDMIWYDMIRYVCVGLCAFERKRPHASCLQLFSHGSECHRSCSTLLVSLACSFRPPPWKEPERLQLRKIWLLNANMLLIRAISKAWPNDFHPVSQWSGSAIAKLLCHTLSGIACLSSTGQISDPRRESTLLHAPIISNYHLYIFI